MHFRTPPIKIAAIAESKRKLKGTMKTNNYIIIHSVLNRSTRPQAGVMIWIHKSIKNTIINYTYESKIIIEVKLHTGKVKLSLFGLYDAEGKKVEENGNFYDRLQNILNKINKSYLFSRELSARIGTLNSILLKDQSQIPINWN
jgi:hypothetical protein